MVPDENHAALSCTISLQGWRTEHQQGSINTVRHSQHQGQFDVKRELILSGITPCVSTLCLPNITTRDQISQAFPLRICILQAIKYWRWERLGVTGNL